MHPCRCGLTHTHALTHIHTPKNSAGNVCMMYLQYAALHQIYHRVPELTKAPLHAEEDGPLPELAQESSWVSALRDFVGHVKVYARQRSFLPGMALAMLYLTVLSFHMTMISYLMVREEWTSLFVFGLLNAKA